MFQKLFVKLSWNFSQTEIFSWLLKREYSDSFFFTSDFVQTQPFIPFGDHQLNRKFIHSIQVQLFVSFEKVDDITVMFGCWILETHIFVGKYEFKSIFRSTKKRSLAGYISRPKGLKTWKFRCFLVVNVEFERNR